MIEPGAALPPQTYRVTRADLVRYAGASGDFNPIHWSDRVATGVGLPGVIAHGMFTMALAGRAVTGWTGDPAALVEHHVRFGRPVVVPDDEQGAEVTEHARRWAGQDALRDDVEALGRPTVELPLLTGPMDVGALFELAGRLEQHLRTEGGRADRGVSIAARNERGAERPAGASGGAA